MSNDYMMVTEVAQMLAVSSATIRRMEKRGDLKSFRNNYGWRVFDRKEVERYHKSRKSRTENGHNS